MTKEAALFQFFNSFGIPAYPSTAVPKEAKFPWITYDPVTDAWGGGEVNITVNIWYYTTDENEPNAKARELAEAIPWGGKSLRCDDGYIWLKKGSPWCQPLQDPNETNIKRRYINVTAEFMTLN